jgi:hypothetical protein
VRLRNGPSVDDEAGAPPASPDISPADDASEAEPSPA